MENLKSPQHSQLIMAFLAGLVTAVWFAWTTLAQSTGGNVTESSLSLLFQNDYNYTNDASKLSVLLLDPVTYTQAQAICASYSEQLLPASQALAHASELQAQFAYLSLSRGHAYDSFFINGGVLRDGAANLSVGAAPVTLSLLPALCTQSSRGSTVANSTASASNMISVTSNTNTFVGYRNAKSFRFLGIPYTNGVRRWQYSSLYSQQNQTINATAYGDVCYQLGTGNYSEQCLFLNIQTPYIPTPAQANSNMGLKPIMFWIHGGGYTGGEGSDPTSDGSNLAARSDIVVVTINYRLSTLGFLAVPNSTITGNFGIADQTIALDWVIQNIRAFGGDPTKITIIGESAGAGSVRALLGSPQAIGKFQGLIAMSNLGGVGYATTFSDYLTVQQSYVQAGQTIYAEVNCTTGDNACLNSTSASALVNAATVGQYVVQDGVYVNTERLNVANATGAGAVAHIPTIWGNEENDGASFSTYPKTGAANLTDGLMKALSVNATTAQSYVDSGLFPYYNSGNLTLDSFNVSQRIATDNQFRCIDQATVWAGVTNDVLGESWYYNVERSIAGYDPNGLRGPPVTPGYPYGNPNLPYFKVHGSDMPFVFGTWGDVGQHYRDDNDLFDTQLMSDYFASFVRTFDPNPSLEYLTVRGYLPTLAAANNGTWSSIDPSNPAGSVRRINYPPSETTFIDVPQCAFLQYPITYYL